MRSCWQIQPLKRPEMGFVDALLSLCTAQVDQRIKEHSLGSDQPELDEKLSLPITGGVLLLECPFTFDMARVQALVSQTQSRTEAILTFVPIERESSPWRTRIDIRGSLSAIAKVRISFMVDTSLSWKFSLTEPLCRQSGLWLKLWTASRGTSSRSLVAQLPRSTSSWTSRRCISCGVKPPR